MGFIGSNMQQIVRDHYNSIARDYDQYKRRNNYYYSFLKRFISAIIPEDSKVLEIGCATGELLDYVRPKYGLGIDIAENMVSQAKIKSPHLHFICSDIENLSVSEKFEYIIVSNLLDYLPDLWIFFSELKKFTTSDSKIIINTINPLWEGLMRLGSKIGLRTPDCTRNFVTNNDVLNLLYLQDYNIIEKGYRLIIPKNIPFISSFMNAVIAKIPVINNLCFVQYIIAKPKSESIKKMSCSVVIPCLNEEENIVECVKRVPQMGEFTETIVVDDGSTDKTSEVVQKHFAGLPNIKLITFPSNRGKVWAVKAGFDSAKGDVLMILDADMTVPPEELVKFFKPLQEKKAEFVNGSRMLYPMEQNAMKMLNYLGNKFFGILLSLIMGQRNTDTLCGTKAMLKKHYQHMRVGFDPWGDFDFLFESARMKLKTVEMPIHYASRVGGESKMKTFSHTWNLIKACYRGLKIIP